MTLESISHSLSLPLVLSGPMGVGKSTLGHLIANRIQVPFFDLDQEIEQATGVSIAEFFTQNGEENFRKQEAQVLQKILKNQFKYVLALGGGTITNQALRQRLIQETMLISLEASTTTLIQRLQSQGMRSRPLLTGTQSQQERLEDIIKKRKDLYAEAHAVLSTESRSFDELADQILTIWQQNRVLVPLGTRSYCIQIGDCILEQMPTQLARLGGSIFLVSDENVWRNHGHFVERLLSANRIAAKIILNPGETNKTIESVKTIWDAALHADIDRQSIVLAIGGGVITDLAGFAAATLLRGIRTVYIPTTLLAMVDASVGGKTGIDHAAGKNLIGAFHQPSAVFIDTQMVQTLPEREFRSGLAEIVKIAALRDESLFEILEQNVDAILKREAHVLIPILRRAIALKAEIVSLDEHESSGLRMILNFGHTLGHALEAQSNFTQWTHGEAVSLGMIGALSLGIHCGLTSLNAWERTHRLLQHFGLPTQLNRDEVSAALRWIAHDKKRSGSHIRWILLTNLGATCIEPIKLDELRAEDFIKAH